MQEAVLLVYVTFPDLTSAQAIAKAVVQERLAACANLLGAMQSLYWWEGAVQDEAETAVFLKTTQSGFFGLEQRIKELHPYQVPCIVALPIGQGHGPFLDWVRQQVV